MTMGSSDPGRRAALKESRRSSRSDSHTGVLQAPAMWPSANSEPRRASRKGAPDWNARQASSALMSRMGLEGDVSAAGAAAGAGEGAGRDDGRRPGWIGWPTFDSGTMGRPEPGRGGWIFSTLGAAAGGRLDRTQARRRAGEARLFAIRAATSAIPARARTRRRADRNRAIRGQATG